jgi:hypothetical protein
MKRREFLAETLATSTLAGLGTASFNAGEIDLLRRVGLGPIVV